MKYAVDQDLDECITVDELLEYLPIVSKYHRFTCPKCDKWVTPVKAELRKKHFKHLIGSPNCPDYFGGVIHDEGNISSINVSSVNRNLKPIFMKDSVKIHDPKHTFRSEDLTLNVKCSNCYCDHLIYVICNVNLDISVYLLRGIKTFTYYHHLGKFRCDTCKKYFYKFEDIEKEWAKEYGKKKVEKKLGEILDEFNDLSQSLPKMFK